MSASFKYANPTLVLSVVVCSHLRADKAVRAPMRSNSHSVFETVREKRRWHTPPDFDAAKLGFRGWYSRGYLPHFDLPRVVQFINYRLDDAMPASLRYEWAALLEIDDELKRRTKIEEYLDRGRGSCLLRDERAAAVVEENWLHSDGQHYRLLAWVIMPNHVHLLVEIWQTPQSQVIKGWKGFTARRINRTLNRHGKLWQDDYWDRYIRDETHYRSTIASWFCNIVDCYIPLVKDVRRILPPLMDGETIEVSWQDEPDLWFPCKVSRSKRAVYNLEGRLKDIFNPFPSGVRLHVIRVNLRQYRLGVMRQPHTVPNCKLFVGDGRGGWQVEIHDQEPVEWETGDQVFRHQLTLQQMEALHNEARVGGSQRKRSHPRSYEAVGPKRTCACENCA